MRGLNASEKKQRILTMMDLLEHSSNEHAFVGPNVEKFEVEAGLCRYKKILNKRKMARLQSTIDTRYTNNKTNSMDPKPSTSRLYGHDV